jgi:peptidoglycan hydrolase-like protein with peptidoglycan-binding domain
VFRKMRCLRVIAALSLAAALLAGSIVPCGIALADGSLRRGDKGTAVKDLQKLLDEHDCYDFDEYTGYYGAVTEAGVRKFQTLNGLKVDGVAGSATMAKLKQTKDIKLKNPDSLCLGMSGQKVTEVQNRLMDLGLYTEPEATGYFGPATEKAVKAFQEASGMTVDGIVGTKTKSELFKQFQSTTMMPGMKGDNVKKLQQRLKDLGYYTYSVTGFYGQITEKAVTYFQKLNGLLQDGICGKNTYNAVFDKNARTEKDARRDPKPEVTPKPAYTNTPGQSASGQAKGQAIVDYAKLQLGKKYVYGTAGPNTFDCTGLTCYVYKHFGVSLPRSAYDQGNTDYGVKITSKSKLMPGDLVFFKHSDGKIGHAGIYVGGGNYIHAPQTGDVVKISSITSNNKFVFGRRVFN